MILQHLARCGENQTITILIDFAISLFARTMPIQMRCITLNLHVACRKGLWPWPREERQEALYPQGVVQITILAKNVPLKGGNCLRLEDIRVLDHWFGPLPISK